MTTLLTVGNSEGSRRCDAKCHDATEVSCNCVCGGRYHGRGEAAARDQIADDLENDRFGPQLGEVARQLRRTGVQSTLF